MIHFDDTLPTDMRWEVSQRINDAFCPDRWERIRLSEIATVQNGFPFESHLFSTHGNDHAFPLIRIRDVGQNDTDTYYTGQYARDYVVHKGDFIVGMDGEFRCRKWTGRDALLNQRVCRLLPRIPEVTLDFAFHFIQPYLRAIEQVTSSVTVKHLSSKTIADLEIPFPPHAEQRRIVTKIEALQARSRKAREVLAEVPELLEQFRQSVLAAAFRGDLTADWREQVPVVEPASALLERIRDERRRTWENSQPKRKYIAPEPVDDSELPELPETWCWACADEVVEPGAEIIYGIVQPGPRIPDGIPYVRGTDIQDGTIHLEQLWRTSPEIANRYKRATLRGGDVLLGIIRATKVAVVPDALTGGNITQGTARFRPSSAITTDFLAYWLDSPFAQRWLHDQYRGIDMPGLNLRDVRRLPVPLAPLREQRILESKLSFQKQRIRVARESVSLNVSDVDELDQSILAKAFRGELVPQDPNDEPAAVLLERIRIGKAVEGNGTGKNGRTSQTRRQPKGHHSPKGLRK